MIDFPYQLKDIFVNNITKCDPDYVKNFACGALRVGFALLKNNLYSLKRRRFALMLLAELFKSTAY